MKSHELQLISIGHAYGGRQAAAALEDISLTVGRGEFCTLLGASGSGKSTLLRIIGGYIYPTRGTVLLDGEDITRLPPRYRGMGMVFQDYALFPHMSVSENIAYGLRARGVERNEVRKRVGNMLELNRLTGLEDRHPGQLSGGQQQRVALARALVINPTVLLMDEAMGALDLRLRESMEVEVRKIQRELGITTLHVTHDQAEAMTMSDRVVVLRDGKIEQVGAPQELIMRPSSRHVAEFVGSNNILSVQIGRSGSDGVWGTVSGIESEVQLSTHNPSLTESSCFLVIRTEEMKASGSPDSRGISGKVVATKYLGTNRCLVVETAKNEQLLVLDPIEQFSIGQQVYLTWPPGRARLISDSPAGLS